MGSRRLRTCFSRLRSAGPNVKARTASSARKLPTPLDAQCTTGKGTSVEVLRPVLRPARVCRRQLTQAPRGPIIPQPLYLGEVAERLKALVSKTSVVLMGYRGFESHPLRFSKKPTCSRLGHPPATHVRTEKRLSLGAWGQGPCRGIHHLQSSRGLGPDRGLASLGIARPVGQKVTRYKADDRHHTPVTSRWRRR